MKSRVTVAVMIMALVGAQIPVFAQSAGARVDLAAGIRQVEEGDFEASIVTLDRAVKALSAEKGASKDLAKAYLYLAIANLGLSQETAAKARLLDALTADKSLSLSPDQYPPNVIKLFDEVRREAGVPVAAATPQPTPQPSKKKGGSKLPLILGAAAVAGGVGYFALKGGNSAPTAGSLIVENREVTPIASLSEVVLIADGASDPDGDSLSYYWEFGDGHEMEGGQRMVHLYEGPGDFLVVVTVSDGKKDASTQATVRVKSLDGRWNGTIQGFTSRLEVEAQQRGRDLQGSYSFGSIRGQIEGTIQSNRSVTITFSAPGYTPFRFTGEISNAVDRMTGSVTGSGFTGQRVEFVR
jgi:hypothetical protein